MRVYSSTLNAFTERLKAEAKRILSDEMGLPVRRSRFLFNGYLYPFTIVAFESPNKLGYFNSENFQIGINKNLVYTAKPEVLKNLLRHELAHMYIFLHHGDNVQAHGDQFKRACQEFGWGVEVSKSYSDLIKENKIVSAPEFEKVLSKVKKLLKLAKSANQHEASLATAKANDLLLKYNLAQVETDNETEEVCVMNVYEAPRKNVQMSALYEILEHFYVQPVFNRGQKKAYLEVIGSRANVEMANYIAKFLINDFERLYKQSGLKGRLAKNSFIRGVGEGFSLKITSLRDHDPGIKAEIVKLERVLKKQVSIVYSRMGSSSSNHSGVDLKASTLGREAGKNLSINKGVNQASTLKRIGLQ